MIFFKIMSARQLHQPHCTNSKRYWYTNSIQEKTKENYLKKKRLERFHITNSGSAITNQVR